jgi:hypothetical protein
MVKMSSAYLTNHHAMKMYGGVEVYLHAFLTSIKIELRGEIHVPSPYSQENKPQVPTA